MTNTVLIFFEKKKIIVQTVMSKIFHMRMRYSMNIFLFFIFEKTEVGS